MSGAGLGVLVLGLAVALRAGARQDDIGAALAAADPDPLAFARVAGTYREPGLLPLLQPGQPVTVTLLALRAVPWLEASWLALPALPPLLRSRDSVLGAAAAASLTAIVSGLDAARLDRREADRAELCAVRAPLVQAADDSAVRLDVRLSAAAAAHLLDGLCGGAVPEAEP